MNRTCMQLKYLQDIILTSCKSCVHLSPLSEGVQRLSKDDDEFIVFLESQLKPQ